MSAAPQTPDLIAQIAARYGASVAPGVTVRRCALGESSRPLPVWDGRKLVVPDWKEQQKLQQRAGVRRAQAARKAGMARDAQVMDRILASHAAGMRPAAIAAIVDLRPDQVYRLLRGAGVSVERVNPGPSQATLAKADLVRRLVAEGKSRADIAAEAGFANPRCLMDFVKRSVPGLSLPVAPRGAQRLAAVAGDRPSRAVTPRSQAGFWDEFKRQQADRVLALLAEGADIAALSSDLQINNLKYLRRLVRKVAPGHVFEDRRAARLAALDAQVLPRLIAGETVRAIAAALQVGNGVVIASVARLRTTGQLPEDVVQARRARGHFAPREVLADRDAAILKRAEPGRAVPKPKLSGRDLAILARAEGEAYPAIARDLGLTVPQVKAAVARLRAAGKLAPASVRRMPMREGSMNGAAPRHKDRTAAILDLHDKGGAVSAIAASVGAPNRAGVVDTLRKAGREPRFDTRQAKAERLAELPGLVAQGLTAAQIADRWGKKVSYVYQVASKAQIGLGYNAASPTKGVTGDRVKARRELVLQLYRRGETHAAIMARLNISQATLSADIKALGISGTSAYARSRRKAAADDQRRAA